MHVRQFCGVIVPPAPVPCSAFPVSWGNISHTYIACIGCIELQTDTFNEELQEELPGRASQLITDLIMVVVPDDGLSVLPLDLDSANTAIDIALE